MSKQKFIFKYKLHHFLFWLGVFGVWYYLRYQDYNTDEIALKITFVKVSALATAVYITNYLLIPGFLYKKKYLFAVGGFLFPILASSIVNVFLMAESMNQPNLFSLTGNLKTRLYENLISDFFLVLTGATFKLIYDYMQMQQRLAEIAKEKAETELNFLKSQINPHFLFNSLNSVYFLIDKDNPEARNALPKFSEMLRYQLYEMMNGQNIPIEKEIRYLEDYVDLQKLRKDEKYSVQFDCSPEVKGFSIEPLLLIPFVENAFKHISHSSDKINFIQLSMHRSNGEFQFSIKNSKETNQRITEQHVGIGLNNVKRRLELLYPGNYDLQIQDFDETFSVDLKLKIDN